MFYLNFFYTIDSFIVYNKTNEVYNLLSQHLKLAQNLKSQQLLEQEKCWAGHYKRGEFLFFYFY